MLPLSKSKQEHEGVAADAGFPAEAHGTASIDVQCDKLANGSCTEQLRYARKIVGDIVSVCGSIMPATTEPEDAQAAVPENSRGVEIVLTWSESALEEAQLWARVMRTGKSHALAPLARGSAAEASLDGIVFNKLAPKLPPSLQREVGADARGSDKSDLPRFGASTAACSRGFVFLVYRAAMPVTQNDEKADVGVDRQAVSAKEGGPDARSFGGVR